MLAIATMATGFVVAAVTPSHALGENLAEDVEKTVGTLHSLGDVIADDSLDLGENALGQNG